MRLGYLLMWLERFKPTEDVECEMDCFHGEAKLKVSSETAGEHFINLMTGDCSMPAKE